MKYEIQQYTLSGVWLNFISDEGKPVQFETAQEAATALGEHFGAMEHSKMQFEPDDYRIARISHDFN